jgi:hypothetical protein
MSLIENKRLKCLLKKFEQNKNKHFYYKLCNYISKKVSKRVSKIKSYNFLLTDEAGVLIYNSQKLSDNTWNNYKNGGIKYNNVNDVNFMNSAEKLGNKTFLKINKSGCIEFKNAKKLGSTAMEKFEENSTSIQNIIIMTGGTILIVAIGYFYFFRGTEEYIITYEDGSKETITNPSKNKINEIIRNINNGNITEFTHFNENRIVESNFVISDITKNKAIDFVLNLP